MIFLDIFSGYHPGQWLDEFVSDEFLVGQQAQGFECVVDIDASQDATLLY